MSHSAPDPVPQGRGGPLDALRFIAALLIVLYHFGADAPVELAALHPVFARGYLATDFFLILSGYVLGRAYGPGILAGRIGFGDFLKKRLTRVWPAQLMVLAALGAVVLLAGLIGAAPAHPDHFSLRAMVMQALLVQAWGLPGGGGWNHQSWSLSALVVCYAAFPLTWRWISRMVSPSALLALGMAAVMVGDLICLRVFEHHIYDLDFSLGVVRTAPLFLLGVCIARVVEQGRPSVGMARLLAWLAGATLVLLQLTGRFDLPSIFAIAAIVLALGRLPVQRPSRLIEAGAKLSFALFITHALTGLVWFGGMKALSGRLRLEPWMDWAMWAGSIPAALVGAALFHRLVDRPVQAWLVGRRDRRRVARAAGLVNV
ncbi:MAG: acyltransferase [Caulobacter sp.]|nr:acyltransferase [Caulobacter sp.]